MKSLKIKNLSIIILIAFAFCACNENLETNDASMIGNLRGDKVSDRFESEIVNFEESDRTKMPSKNGILFTGSSSIRMWETLEKDMAPLPVINRGFGGSTIPEVMKYADRIIFPYEPQIIVLYCGENDIWEKTLTEITVRNFKQFVGMVQKKLPETEVVFLSMKPSPARSEKWGEYEKGNLMIKHFAKSQPKVHFVNVSRTMLSKTEQIDSLIFIEDGLHMNKFGYTRWTALVKPKLKKLYKAEN